MSRYPCHTAPCENLLVLGFEYYDCFLLIKEGDFSLELNSRTFLFLTPVHELDTSVEEQERKCVSA